MPKKLRTKKENDMLSGAIRERQRTLDIICQCKRSAAAEEKAALAKVAAAIIAEPVLHVLKPKQVSHATD